MGNTNIVDYFDYINHPNARLIWEMFQGTPVVDQIPVNRDPLLDNRQVEFAVQDSLPASQTRVINGSYIKTVTNKPKYKKEDLLIRGNEWEDDNYYINTPSGAARSEREKEKFLRGIGKDINEDIVTGTKSAKLWSGFDQRATSTSTTGTHGTLITTAALAQTTFENMMTLLQTMYNVDVCFTGPLGFQILRLMQRYLGTLNITLSENVAGSTVGSKVNKIICDFGEIPVIDAGKKRDNTSVIVEASNLIAFYFVDLSDETGIGWAVDGNLDIKEIETTTGMTYGMEFYNLLYYRTNKSVGKFTQKSS